MRELIAEVDYAGRPNDPGGLYRVEVREGFGKHALAMLDYPAPRRRRSLIAENTPITLTWGWAPLELRDFYGYVNHHEIVEGVDGTQFLRTFVLGTSMPLNDSGSSVWEKVSPSFIAKTVATRRGLRCVLHQAPRVLPYWAQGNDSDFAMMKRLAEKIGFRFWVDGPTMYFLDPGRMLRQPTDRRTPTFEMYRDGYDDSLKDVKVISGSMAPGGASIQEVFGLDSNTGKLIKANSSRVFEERGLMKPSKRSVYPHAVGSLQEARQVNEANAARGTWAHIEASVVGAPRARIGRLVTLGGDALNDSHEGDWLVSDATHVLEVSEDRQKTYMTDLSLTRNNRRITRSNTSAFRDAHREIPARLTRNHWESQVLESVYV